MPVNLTANAISAINAGDMKSNPVVQVLDIKQIGTTQEQYQLTLSDSESTQQATLATILNDLVKSDRVRKTSVIQLIEYICSTVQNRKIIVISNMKTIKLQYEIIGNPKVIVEAALGAEITMSSGASGSSNLSAQRFDQDSFLNIQNLSIQNSGNSMQNYPPAIQSSNPNYKSHWPIMKNKGPACITPIRDLKSGDIGVAVKARVTGRGNIIDYASCRVFTFDLIDSGGAVMRVVCFNAFAERCHKIVEPESVYMISDLKVKPINDGYPNVNVLELHWDQDSVINICPDDGSIPRLHISFQPISEIENTKKDSIINVIGLVISVTAPLSISTKEKKKTQRQKLTLEDQSGQTVVLELWGCFCDSEGKKLLELVETGVSCVLAIQGARVCEFTGKYIGTISSTQLFINPDSAAARTLREWFNQKGKDIASQSISRDNMPIVSNDEIRRTIFQIKHEGVGRSDKTDWVIVEATITSINTDSWCLTVCPLLIGDKICNEEVTESENCKWYCIKCNKVFEECHYIYKVRVKIQDHTDSTWMTISHESAATIFGHTAKGLYIIQHEQAGGSRFHEIMRRSLFTPFMFKLKGIVLCDEEKLEATVVMVEKLFCSEESKYLSHLL